MPVLPCGFHGNLGLCSPQGPLSLHHPPDPLDYGGDLDCPPLSPWTTIPSSESVSSVPFIELKSSLGFPKAELLLNYVLLRSASTLG